VGQTLLRFRVVQAEQGTGVAGTDDPRGDTLLHGWGEVEQPEGVADVGTRAAYLLGQLLVGGTEIVQQLLVGRRFFQRVKLLTVQVLDQGVSEQVVVLRLFDDGADLGKASAL